MSLFPTQAVIARAIRRQADALHLDASWPSRCCDVRGGCELRPKLLYAIMQQVDELGSIGVLPSLIVLMLLVVPYSLHTNILQPCWECYDFEVS